eukprot:TRINITY_DN9195_c1_g1_i1.p1 TRINITY_DN9195_c1_g1~~TRINITY_DN9195_c1_g1_i1.p1  ORF type:complete len:107 (+),score=3.52 TRINITY_DN9195_c1_g1_i1:109-429(+)
MFTFYFKNNLIQSKHIHFCQQIFYKKKQEQFFYQKKFKFVQKVIILRGLSVAKSSISLCFEMNIFLKIFFLQERKIINQCFQKSSFVGFVINVLICYQRVDLLSTC